MMYKPKKMSTYFLFTKEQQRGISGLFVVIVILQLLFFFSDFNFYKKQPLDEKKWLSQQTELNLIKEQKQQFIHQVRPFNPNYITDFKGYKLGMSVAEIDRLLVYRRQNKFVNSASEFQKVTKVSDDLLRKISPYFKFPDWVNKRNSVTKTAYYPTNVSSEKKTKTELIDLNLASKDDLMEVYGVGEKLSDRILKYKEVLGGFVAMDQLHEVWGLQPEVIEKIQQKFNIGNGHVIKKININQASIKELGQFP